MKLNVVACAMTSGIIWSAAVLLVAVANLAWPGYGRAFLDLVASIYPGYHPGSGLGSAITGALYGLVDGTVGGAVVAWLYNRLAQRGAVAAR